jgi:hypothetical protein
MVNVQKFERPDCSDLELKKKKKNLHFLGIVNGQYLTEVDGRNKLTTI